MSKINFLYPFNVTGAINSSSTYNINNNTVLSPTTLTLTTTNITNGGTYNLKLPSTLGTSNQASIYLMLCCY